MARIEVFAPHPDDDVIGCGGSIAKYVRDEHAVTIVYLTSGDAGGLGHSKGELARLREAEAAAAAAAAAKLLGVTDLVFLRTEDGYLECTKETLTRVIDLISRISRTSTRRIVIIERRMSSLPKRWCARAARASRNAAGSRGL